MHPARARLLEEARDLDRRGNRDEALQGYLRFLALEPASAEAWADYGGLLLDLGRFAEGRDACRRALESDPEHVPALINLASSLLGLQAPQEAMALFERVIAIDPGRLEGHLGLGTACMQHGDPTLARQSLERALLLAPADEQTHRTLIQALGQAGDWAAVKNVWEHLVDAAFQGRERMWERSILRLLFAELPEAWELYEARFQIPDLVKPARDFPQPRWSGEPFPGRTLLLHWEQGLGDTAMFVRYASMVKARGGRVLLEAQRPIADLMATCPGLDAVIAHGDPLPPFDLQLPLLSLPHVFRTTLDTIPAPIPYLDVPANVPSLEALRERMASADGRARVGLVWAGSAIHMRDKGRSIPAPLLEPLAGLSGVQWFSLQRERSGELSWPGMVSLGDLLSNFSDTAYVLSGLDLLITVDTAVAHIAGAMGVPVLLLVSFIPDWRWMLQREDSPWYPNLRIYRQPRPQEWGQVITRLVRDLR